MIGWWLNPEKLISDFQFILKLQKVSQEEIWAEDILLVDGEDSLPLEIEAEEVVLFLYDANWQGFHQVGSVVAEEAEEETSLPDLLIKCLVIYNQECNLQ